MWNGSCCQTAALLSLVAIRSPPKPLGACELDVAAERRGGREEGRPEGAITRECGPADEVPGDRKCLAAGGVAVGHPPPSLFPFLLEALDPPQRPLGQRCAGAGVDRTVPDHLVEQVGTFFCFSVLMAAIAAD